MRFDVSFTGGSLMASRLTPKWTRLVVILSAGITGIAVAVAAWMAGLPCELALDCGAAAGLVDGWIMALILRTRMK
jgi:hypothetical protein